MHKHIGLFFKLLDRKHAVSLHFSLSCLHIWALLIVLRNSLLISQFNFVREMASNPRKRVVFILRIDRISAMATVRLGDSACLWADFQHTFSTIFSLISSHYCCKSPVKNLLLPHLLIYPRGHRREYLPNATGEYCASDHRREAVDLQHQAEFLAYHFSVNNRDASALLTICLCPWENIHKSIIEVLLLKGRCT